MVNPNQKNYGRFLPLVFIVMSLAACQTTSNLYDWGSYEMDLYRYYKTASLRPNSLNKLQVLINRLESTDKTIPPGLYSELGTYYLEANQRSKAIEFYKRESELWPESKKLMDTLVANLEARGAGNGAN